MALRRDGASHSLSLVPYAAVSKLLAPTPLFTDNPLAEPGFVSGFWIFLGGIKAVPPFADTSALLRRKQDA